MINYRVQNGCGNCVHVFRRFEYDEDDEFYCTLNAPPRPLCGSVAADEWWRYSDTEREARADAWYEWRHGREVEARGFCDAWRAGEVQP